MSPLESTLSCSCDTSDSVFATQGCPTEMSFTAVDLWLEEVEANLNEEVRTVRELAWEAEAERAYWDLMREEAEKEEEKALLREFAAIHGAEEAYHDTLQEQHRQQMRAEAAYEDAYHDTLQEQHRQQM